MRMLFNSIEDIRINGNPSELCDVISDLDKCVQDMTNHTNEIFNIMIVMSGTLKSQQFEKAAGEIRNLSIFLCEKADALNEMQRDVADYHNRISRFEGYNQEASYNQFDIRPVNVDVETKSVQLTGEQWFQIYSAMCEYCNAISESVNHLISRKNDVGTIWQDTQYYRFSDFIDSIATETNEKVKVLEDYIQNLKAELSQLGIVV